jgi:hypothetical protein
MNAPATVRPSVWYYSLAAPFLVVGLGIFVYTLVQGITHVTDSLTQVVVPGEADLTLKHGETYTVFYEQQSVVNGKIYSANGPLSGLKCTVNSLFNRDSIPLRLPSMSTTYDVGGRSGRSVLEFTVTRDEQYHFACGYDEGSRGPEVVLAVGSGVGQGIMKTVFSSLGAMFGGGGLAAIVIVTVFVLRERSKKRIVSSVQAPI